MKYYRWTTRDLDSLILGKQLSSVCTEAGHDHCMSENKGCISVLKRGSMPFPGNTLEERMANRERAAKEAQAKCRKVKVVIDEAELCTQDEGLGFRGYKSYKRQKKGLQS